MAYLVLANSYPIVVEWLYHFSEPHTCSRDGVALAPDGVAERRHSGRRCVRRRGIGLLIIILPSERLFSVVTTYHFMTAILIQDCYQFIYRIYTI